MGERGRRLALVGTEGDAMYLVDKWIYIFESGESRRAASGDRDCDRG